MVGDGGAAPGRIRVHALVDNLGAGGAELLLAYFAEVAGDAGIALSVGTLQPFTPESAGARRLRRRGIEPAVVPISHLLGARDFLRVRAHIAAVRPDLVHTHLEGSDALGNLAARSLGIPSVATIHANWWPTDLRSRVRMSIVSRARRHCTHRVIAVSESARTEYLAAGRDTPDHVIVVYNGIADRRQPGAGVAFRRSVGLEPDDIVVAMVSALRPEKNFEAAIDAVTVLAERFPKLRLVVAGDGPHRTEVRRLAEPLGQRVRVLGHREDVMSLLDASDVLLLPSLVEAFPTTLLEALAASVPVVATATGGILEMVEDGRSAILVPPPPTGEAVARRLAPVLEDESARRRLGRAGRCRFEAAFGARAWAERTRAVYDDVLAGGAFVP